MQYLTAEDAINLTRTCSEFYIVLPRNSAFGVSVWRMYLSKSSYIGNRMVFETGKFLLESDQVSRANYKLILCLLVEKNGFMKISKLKSLCASGKLSVPIIPKSGKWRELVRLDQFALKRAAASSSNETKSKQSSPGISMVSFVSRLVGRPGKFEIVLKHVSSMTPPDVFALVNLLMSSDNLGGVSEIISIRDSLAESLITECVLPYKGGILGDNALHVFFRDKSITNGAKQTCLAILLRYPCTRVLLDGRNLEGSTPLHLCPNVDIFDLLVKHGADPRVPNNKGEVAKRVRIN